MSVQCVCVHSVRGRKVRRWTSQCNTGQGCIYSLDGDESPVTIVSFVSFYCVIGQTFPGFILKTSPSFGR